MRGIKGQADAEVGWGITGDAAEVLSMDR